MRIYDEHHAPRPAGHDKDPVRLLFPPTPISHRITESFGLKSPLSQTIPPAVPKPPLTMYISVTSTQLIHSSRGRDSITAMGSLCQSCTILLEMKFSLLLNLNLPCCNLSLFPLILSFVPGEKCPTPTLGVVYRLWELYVPRGSILFVREL